MMRLMYTVLIAAVGLAAGGAVAADDPPQQGRVISVRPAIPDGAKAFVAQQNKIEQDRQKKPLFGQKKSSQPPGYEFQAVEPAKKPSSGTSFWDIFNPAKWGKGKPPANTNLQQAPQAPQMEHFRQSQQQGGWTQPSGDQSPTWNQPTSGQGEPASEQIPPPNVAAPASQPG